MPNIFAFENIEKKSVVNDHWQSKIIGSNIWLESTVKHSTKYGWQISLNIASDQIEKAWNCVSAILCKEKIQAKIPKPSNKFPKFSSKITVFCSDNNHIDWQKVISGMERNLLYCGVEPACFDSHSRPISGSCYFSYHYALQPGEPSFNLEGYNSNNNSGFLWDISLKPGSEHNFPQIESQFINQYLNNITPGWNESDKGWLISCENFDIALSLEKCCRTSGIEAIKHKNQIFVRKSEYSNVLMNWHQAMEIMQTVDLGNSLKKAIWDYSQQETKIYIQSRSSDSCCSKLIIHGASENINEALTVNLGNCGLNTINRNKDLVISYCGSLHRKQQSEEFLDSVSYITNEAFGKMEKNSIFENNQAKVGY